MDHHIRMRMLRAAQLEASKAPSPMPPPPPAPIPTPADSAAQMQCASCKVKPAEYGPESKEITIRVQLEAGGPIATEKFQPGNCCEACVEAEVLKRFNALFDREQVRSLYRQELQRLQAAGKPLICSDCRKEIKEFVEVSVGKIRQGILCQSCLYVKLRNEKLQPVTTMSDARDRCRVVLTAMEQAKQETRRAFEYVWDE